MEKKKTIFLARHGATDFNERDLLQGRIDLPLSKNGEKEAQALGCRLKAEKLDMIFHSPLQRSRQTAQIVNYNHKVPLKNIDCFTEIDMGEFEGINYRELTKKKPTFFTRWHSDLAVSAPGGESFAQVFSRVKAGVNEIMKDSFDNILIVGHSAVNRGILAHLIKMNHEAARVFTMKNCAFAKFVVYPQKSGFRIVVESWNNNSHLE